MNNEPRVSLLSRTVTCEGRDLYIDIHEDESGGWLLAVSNEQGVTSHWTEPFKSESGALKAALKAIKEEGLEGFHMEQPWKYGVH
jgi:hypothetical protein